MWLDGEDVMGSVGISDVMEAMCETSKYRGVEYSSEVSDRVWGGCDAVV